MTDLPAPLTPTDCDLRGFEFMPLYGERMFTSATWIAAKPDAKIAALRLWWHSYAKELPAASLPDDDALLSEYAGYGVAVPQWRKVRDAALRGWIKCSDGRLYHKVLAEIALESWSGRKESRSEADRKKRERQDRARLFADLAEVRITPAWNIKTGDLRDLHRKHVTDTGHDKSVTGSVTGSADVTARQLQGKDRTGEEDNLPPPESRPADGAMGAAQGRSLSAVDWIETRLPLLLAKVKNIDPTSPGIQNVAPLRHLEAEGLDFDADILPALIAVGASWDNPKRRIVSWKLPQFADMAHANHQRRTNPENRDARPHHNGAGSFGADAAGTRHKSRGLVGEALRIAADEAQRAGGGQRHEARPLYACLDGEAEDRTGQGAAEADA